MNDTGRRSNVLKNSPRVIGRPGAEMPPLDFDTLKQKLDEKFGSRCQFY